jgi:hypothetical protein
MASLFSEVTCLDSLVNLVKLGYPLPERVEVSLPWNLKKEDVDKIAEYRIPVSEMSVLVRKSGSKRKKGGRSEQGRSDVIDLSGLTGLRKLKIEGSAGSVLLPHSLTELDAARCWVGEYKNMANLLKLRILKYRSGRNGLAPYITVLENRDENPAKRWFSIPATLTSIDSELLEEDWATFPSFFPPGLTSLSTVSYGKKISLPLEGMRKLRFLNCPYLNSENYPMLASIPLLSLSLLVKNQTALDLLSSSIPSTLENLEVLCDGKLVLAEDLQLKTLSFSGLQVNIPYAVTSLHLFHPVGRKKQLRAVFPSSLNIKLLHLGPSHVNSDTMRIDLVGLSSSMLENLEVFNYTYHLGFLPFIRTWGNAFSQSLQSMKIGSDDIPPVLDLKEMFPNLLELQITSIFNTEVTWPPYLQYLRVEKMKFEQIPPDLAKLTIKESISSMFMHVPQDYIFRYDVWRNLACDINLLEFLWPKINQQQREQLRAMISALTYQELQKLDKK